MTEATVSKRACMFSVSADDACKFSETTEADTKVTKLNITGYSGGVIKGHWYWGDLAIDTDGIQFAKDKYPILFAHDTDRRIGFSDKPIIKDHKLIVENGTLLDNDEAKKFKDDCANGFPFEASVYVQPSKIQRLDDGESAEVNGYTLKGPATIFRECTYKEVSACGFGWDSNTSSAVGFSKDGDEELSYVVIHKETKMDFDVEKFKVEDPEGYAKFAASLTSSLEAQVAELQAKLSQKEQEVADATKLSADLTTRIDALERENIKREARDRATAFAAKVEARLAKSSLPEALQGKFAKTVKMEAFTDEKGVFDDAKFSAFMDSELKEWEDAIPAQPAVIGGGSSSFSKEQADDGVAAFGSQEEYDRFMANCGLGK